MSRSKDLKRRAIEVVDLEADAADADAKRNCAANYKTAVVGLLLAAASLDHLPRPALARIIYHTSDINQKLLLALTCRRLYNIVAWDKRAWPAKVSIVHGCVGLHERKLYGVSDAVLVSVGDGDAAADRRTGGHRRLLAETTWVRPLSVMNLPAVCPVPVALRIMPCRGQGRQQQFLIQHLLPWLKQRKFFNQQPLSFSDVHLLFTHAEFADYSRLLYVWCGTTARVHLQLYLHPDDHGPPPTDLRCLSRQLVAHKQLLNVHRLRLDGMSLTGVGLPRCLRRFPAATAVHAGRLGVRQGFGRQWAVVWHEFVTSRAQPRRPHALHVGIAEPAVTHVMFTSIVRMPSGRSVGISNGLGAPADAFVRQLLDEHLQPRLLESIEEQAEVVAVTLTDVQPAGWDRRLNYVWVRTANHNWQWQPLVTLHLRMKHHQQAEWTIHIEASCAH